MDRAELASAVAEIGIPDLSRTPLHAVPYTDLLQIARGCSQFERWNS
jgi:hypothetical protein